MVGKMGLEFVLWARGSHLERSMTVAAGEDGDEVLAALDRIDDDRGFHRLVGRLRLAAEGQQDGTGAEHAKIHELLRGTRELYTATSGDQAEC